MTPAHHTEDTGRHLGTADGHGAAAMGFTRRMVRERFNGIETAETTRYSSAPIPLLVIFAAVMLDGLQVPGSDLPVNSLAVVVVVAVALWFPARGHVRPLWYTALLLGVPAWMFLASYFNDHLEWRRILSVALWTALAMVLSSGRIPLFAVARGIALGLVLGGTVGFVLMPQSSYVGRLTGWFGDPNTAGLFLVVGLWLSFPYLPTRRTKILVGIVGGAALVATFSRTSLLAMAFGLAWMFLGGKINKYFGAAAMTGLVYWVMNLAEDAVRFGPFSQRTGSDMLRDRIMDAEQIAVAQSPVIGNGAGTARLMVNDLPFFFHNSYLAIRAEAGWIGFGIMILLIGGTFLALISLPVHRRSVFAEAAIIGVAVCSANLGESLLALPTALALGFAGHHLAVQRRIMRIEAEQQRQQRWADKLARGEIAGNLS